MPARPQDQPPVAPETPPAQPPDAAPAEQPQQEGLVRFTGAGPTVSIHGQSVGLGQEVYLPDDDETRGLVTSGLLSR